MSDLHARIERFRRGPRTTIGILAALALALLAGCGGGTTPITTQAITTQATTTEPTPTTSGQAIRAAVDELYAQGYVKEWCNSPDIAGDARLGYEKGVAAPAVIRAWELRNDRPEGTWYSFVQRVISEGGCK